MEQGGFKIRFVRLGVSLAQNEVLSPWDDQCPGTLRFENGSIHLSGRARSAIVDSPLVFTAIARPLAKRMLLKERTVITPMQELERVVLFPPKQKGLGKGVASVRLFQMRDDGKVEVHAFLVGFYGGKQAPTIVSDFVQAMRAVVPPSLLKEGNVEPQASMPAAEWYPDPAASHQYRYWDGSSWTDQVADDGVQSVDPLPTGTDTDSASCAS